MTYILDKDRINMVNIFVTHIDPRIAASYLCDKHINKMLVESWQILCTALHIRGSSAPGTYRAAYRHHPCSQWAAESLENWQWLFQHALAMHDEKMSRFGGNPHLSHTKHVGYPFDLSVDWPQHGLTPFARAIKKTTYPHLLDTELWPDTVEVYREYYRIDKASFAKWQRGSGTPYWWFEEAEQHDLIC
jgi:hypothetical protein